MKNFGLTLLFLLVFSRIGLSQSSSDWLFDDTILSEVYIIIEQDSLAEILDFENRQSDYEYPATFVFVKGAERDTVENIGFRLRGNTSRNSQKRSFKVSFNTFESGREYRGLDKMNLNGEHNDPSIIRSKLSWDIFQTLDIPAPRANHVKFYINGEYFGLYINVEHIDNEFIQDRFGSDAGNLYKCLYGATLTDYEGINCELKTNEEEGNKSDLAFLVDFLNTRTDQQFEDQIEDHLNVDGVLQWMAVDILTASWDDYWFLNNNYYLYKNPATKQFEFIPYDYDNTFGIWWDGIYPGIDWGTRNPYEWGHPDQPRPLTERILSVEKYRNRLSFYLDQIMNIAFNENRMFSEIDRLKSITEDAAEDDTYRTLDYGYSVDDYHNSFDIALGGHVTYGIKPYITARINSLNQQLVLENIHPVIRDVQFDTKSSQNGFEFTVEAEILDESAPEITVVIPDSEIEFSLSDPDQNGVFTGSTILDNNMGNFTFYLEAQDEEGLISRFPNNPDRKLEYNFMGSNNDIVINEFMADNESGIQDESGAFEDWVELYNPTDRSVNLTSYYLTDDVFEPLKWALPDTTIQPGEYLLLWADNNDEEGPLHTNFGLSNDGEQIALFFKDILETTLIDSINFGPQSNDISFGRNGDGGDEFVFFDPPTPGTANGLLDPIETETNQPQQVQLFQNYPNPFNPETTISFQLNEASNIKLSVFTIEGRLVQTLVNSRYLSGTHSVRFDASSLSSGMYFYRLETKNQSLTKRLVLIK